MQFDAIRICERSVRKSGSSVFANIPDPISVEESIYDDAMQPSTYKAATTKDILPTLPHLTDEQLGRLLKYILSYTMITNKHKTFQSWGSMQCPRK